MTGLTTRVVNGRMGARAAIETTSSCSRERDCHQSVSRSAERFPFVGSTEWIRWSWTTHRCTMESGTGVEGMTVQTRVADTVDELQEALADDAAFERWYRAALPRVFGYLMARTGGNIE